MLRYSILILGLLLSQPLFASETIIEKSPSIIRNASWNVTVDFFDKEDPQYHKHNWPQRKNVVLETIRQISPDILGVQELSPTQASQLSELEGYRSFFLCQTPSEVKVGTIIDGKEVKNLIGKNIGTALVGIFYKSNKFGLIQNGCFWLNENPDELPTYTDRTVTDKGFGNMNTYRAPLWAQFIHLKTGREVFVFNSHYPLSGTPTTRFKCAEVERKKINEIAGINLWVSMGDRNILPQEDVVKEDMKAMAPLLKDAYNAVEAKHHSGPSTTWAGFDYDKYKMPIVDGKFLNSTALDVMVSNHPAISSQHVVTQFNKSGKIQLNPDHLSEERRLASDHLMVVADYDLSRRQ